MKVIQRLFEDNNVPQPVGERILELITTEVRQRKAHMMVLKDISNMCITTRLSQRHQWCGMKKKLPPHIETDGFFGDQEGYLQYHTRRVYDVTHYDSRVRKAIESRMIRCNCDYGWDLRIIRTKAIIDDYARLLMIETWEDISPDIMRGESEKCTWDLDMDWEEPD